MTLSVNLVGSYDYWLVALSWLIAVLSSYAALDLGGRVTAAAGRVRFVWLSGGAAAMGLGIWSMHYIGMLAYSLPVHVSYDWPTVLLSLLAAVAAAAIALFVVSRNELRRASIGVGGLLMGAGIAAMHYIGMEAMRLPAMCYYSPRIVLLSIVLAIAISVVALWLTFSLRSDTRSLGWRKLTSAVLMGAAIPLMHYTGMAAVTFRPMAPGTDLSHAVEISSLGTVCIVGVSLTILVLAIFTSIVDRRFSAQAHELQLSEQRFRQLVESAQVILWRGAVDVGHFSYVNSQAEELLGYPAANWTMTPSFWLDHLHPDDCESARAYCAAAADGSPQHFEHRMVGCGGNTVWFRTSIRLVPGDETRELAGVMTDVTERKRAQEEAEAASRVKGELLVEVKRLNDQLKQENSRMSSELEVTRRLQQMMLPRDEELRGVPDLDISACMEATGEVGGDYYDVVCGEGRVIFGIGDVTGHGLESGVLAIMVQTAVRTLLASGDFESRKFFDVLNRVVYDNARRMNCDRNLTFSLLRYEDKVITVSGQHEEVLIIRQNGTLEKHDTLDLGFPLGLEKTISGFIAEAKIPLRSGDVLVVYTDGIIEAVNSAGAAYGIERLCAVLRTCNKQLAGEIKETVLRSVREYVGQQRILDDISLLIVKHA